jgi:kinesin family member C1
MPLSNNGAAPRKPLSQISNSSIPTFKSATQKRREREAAAAAAAAKKGEGTATGPAKSGQHRKTLSERSNANAQIRRVNATGTRTARSGLNFTAKPEMRVGASGRGFRSRDEEEDARGASAKKLEAIVAAQIEKLRVADQLSSNGKISESIQELKETLLQSKDSDAALIGEFRAKAEEMEGRWSNAELEISEKNVALNNISIEMAKKEHAFELEKQKCEAKLVAQITEYEDLQHQLKGLNTTIAALETDKKFVDKMVAEKDKEISRLQQLYDEHGKTAQHLRSDANDAKEALHRATYANSSLEQQIDDVNARLRALQQRACDNDMDMVKRDGEMQKLAAQHDAVNAELATLKASLEVERETVAKLRTSLAKAEAEADDMSARHAQQTCALQKDADEYRQKAEKKQQSLEEAKVRAEASLENTNVELHSARSDVAQFRSTMTAQEGALAALKSQMAAIEVKLSAQTDLCVEKSGEIAELRSTIETQMADIAALEEQAHLDEDERRKLHNALQELKGNIRVFCRVRPTLAGESKGDAGNSGSVFQYHTKARGISAVMPGHDIASSSDELPSSAYSKSFKFDRVFDPSSSQEDVFGEISQLVQSALDGYRVCIFAYGQTGSGKTHTIMGKENDLGMIPRSVTQIFDTAERLKKDHWTFELRASFLEIYNEKIRDLLVKGGKPTARGVKKEEYEVTYDRATNQSNIEGLTITEISIPEDASRLIDMAAKNRSTAATLANADSSRSHSVFRLYITGTNSASGQTLSGLLNLVDLAGSERVKVSGAEGDRLKESRAINKSLSQLSTVIMSLAQHEKHIPYRASKLTRVLQDSLGGDCKTLMFVNVAPVPTSYNESLCSLRFAEKVNSCEIGTAKRTTKIDLHDIST